jgi:hypothetical protein
MLFDTVIATPDLVNRETGSRRREGIASRQVANRPKRRNGDG